MKRFIPTASTLLILVWMIAPAITHAGQGTMDGDTLLIPKVSIAPIIDGELDAIWYNVPKTDITRFVPGFQPADWMDQYATFRMAWDDDYIYVLVEVMDNDLSSVAVNSWETDCIELYFDGDNSKNDLNTGYDGNDVQYRYIIDQTVPNQGPAGTIFTFRTVPFGYCFEAAIPAAEMTFTPADDHVVGFEIQISDNDDGIRTSFLKWWSDEDATWHDPSTMGTVRLSSRTVSDALDVEKTAISPLIDGIWEPIWDEVPEVSFNTYVKGAGHDKSQMSGPMDLQMTYRTMWDSDALYLFVRVIDDEINTTGSESWMRDGLELYFDGDNSKNDELAGYDANDRSLRLVYGATGAAEAFPNTVHRWRQTDTGYDFEAKIPAEDLPFTPAEDHRFGFEMQVNDNDGGSRNSIAKWWSASDDTYKNPSLFGTAYLAGMDITLRIYISQPEDDSRYTAGMTVPISASVVSSGDPVARVEFYSNGTQISEDSEAPFNASLENVAEGFYSLAAAVITEGGDRAESSPVHIVVGRDPNLETAPPPKVSQERGFYTGAFSVTLSANAPGAAIQYTLDGSDPVLSATAIHADSSVSVLIDPESDAGRGVTPGVVLRASAIQPGYSWSTPVTHTYLFTSMVKHQTAPGGEWPDHNVNGQMLVYDMDARVVNDSRYSAQIEPALKHIPSISLVTDPGNLFDPDSGIYVNASYHGSDWERPASVELINPDESQGFQIDAGLRIRGGWSRHDEFPKHAFRLFFRKKYGAGKLRFPLFGNEGVDRFDKIDLRTSQNYAWSSRDAGDKNTMNRDVFSRDLQGEMGHPYTRSRYYHLYINGLYWGLYQTQERAESRFYSSYYGGDPEDYDVVKTDIGENWNLYDIEATDGNLDTWQEVWDACQTGFTADADYYRLQGLNPDGTVNPAYRNRVDVDNLIDYMLIIFYTGNFDAPVSQFRGNKDPNNFYAIIDRTGNDGFKFLTQDSEHTLRIDGDWTTAGLYENRVNIADRNDGRAMVVNNFNKFHPQWLHHRLSANAEYRMRFADHVYRHFFNGGVMTPEASTARFLERAHEIRLAIIAESARWGGVWADPPRTKDDDWQPAIDRIVDEFFPVRTGIVLNQLTNAGLYTGIDAPLFKTGGTEIQDESLTVEPGFTLTLANPNTAGIILYTLDGSDPRLSGGAVSPAALNGSGNTDLTVTSTTLVKARILSGATWSALHELQLLTPNDLSALQITEIHYHPQDGDSVNDREFEFIEMKNSGTQALNLTQVAFTDGIGYTFAPGTRLNPSEFIVLASNAQEFNNRYGFEPFGEYSGQLNNGGEDLVVESAGSDTLIAFAYSDTLPWPLMTDGEGYSIVWKGNDPAGDPADPANWRTSRHIHGSPGAEDTLGTAVQKNRAVPSEFALSQNYPNPFNPVTTITYAVPRRSHVTLSVYNTRGRLIEMLVTGEKEAGVHSVRWNASNVGSGIYLYRIQTREFTRVRKCMVIK